MAKLLIAENRDEKRGKKVPKRLAEPSQAKIKAALREFPDTRWKLWTITFSPIVPNLCQLVANFKKVAGEKASEDVRVNGSGQVRGE